MSATLKLVSLNIESHKHLQDRVIPFIQKEQPDVICFQEVFEVDFPYLKETFQMQGQYLPMANVTKTSIHQAHALGSWGVAQFSRLPIKNQAHEYYFHTGEQLPVFFENEDPNHMNRVLAWMEVEKEGQVFRIATSHFIWSEAGQATPLQLECIDKLINIAQPLGDLVICGDFNAPRGRETFNRMAALYKDNIPPEITTTIDSSLHKSKKEINFVVDVLFTTPEYQASDVRIVGGVSDHKAIVASITKV